jgi:hypothetical protein
MPALGLLWCNLINIRFKVKKIQTVAKESEVVTARYVLRERLRRQISLKFSPRLSKRKMEFFIDDLGVHGEPGSLKLGDKPPNENQKH